MVGVGDGDDDNAEEPIGVAVRDGEGDKDGVGVGVGRLGAWALGAVKKGTKLTVPKLKLSLKSKIVWLIACWSVVPQ